MAEKVSAAFDDREDAGKALQWLRDHNVKDDDLTIIASNPGGEDRPDSRKLQGEAMDSKETGVEAAKDMGEGALAGAAVGAGVGALFGLAAVAIAGPIAAAGWLATTLGASATAAAEGAVIGGTAGTVVGALTHWGLSDQEAEHYAKEIESGKVYIGVNVATDSPVSAEEVRDAFKKYNGQFAPKH